MLLRRCAASYAQLPKSPMEQVRVFVTLHWPVPVGGVPASVLRAAEVGAGAGS